MTMRERIAAGNPCKVIREIGERDYIKEKYGIDKSEFI